MKTLSIVLFALLWGAAARANSTAPGKPANTLTAAEKKEGWRLLFDGKTSKGWRAVKGETFPAANWVIDAGLLKCVGAKNHTDIVTTDQYESFDFKWEWRLAAGGNSGVKYLVDEPASKAGFGIGFEYQLIDDDKHPDAKAGRDGNRTVGSLYDLIAASKDKKVSASGEWNESRLLVDGNHIEHWLNGVKVLSFERGSPEMKELIAKSKYKTLAGFGEVSRGPLLLQDHETEIAFRNLKVRALKKK